MFTDTRKSNMADNTASQRQQKRLGRLKEQGIQRTTVLVHEDCKPALEKFRPHFADSAQAAVLADLASEIETRKGPTNVAQVKQLSPFRYPGGKTWLVPEIRKWMLSIPRPSVFVEPFAGGAMAGLTVAAENLADRVILCELDDDVAAVWETIFSGSDRDVAWLTKKITGFKVDLAAVKKIIGSNPKGVREKAFRTILKNRMQRGGIMAPGAGLVKEGEGGKGLLSRWYPETLAKRIQALREIKERVEFVQDDAFDVIAQYAEDPRSAFFVDPPYTAGGKKAGARLYSHNEIDHEKLFLAMRDASGPFMMTYDDAKEVRDLSAKNDFRVLPIPMKNTHHEIIHELLVFRS